MITDIELLNDMLGSCRDLRVLKSEGRILEKEINGIKERVGDLKDEKLIIKENLKSMKTGASRWPPRADLFAERCID